MTHAPTATSKGASAKTNAGDLPPSSRVTCLRLLLAAASWIFLPTVVDPVKLIFEIFRCDASKSPVEPSPVTNCTTPGGNPASAKRGPSASAPSGDFSDDLKMNWSGQELAKLVEADY